MKYRMLLSDIDGTLRPLHRFSVPEENVEAIRAIQAIGVRFAISTGRSRMTVPAGMLNGIVPDYWICAAGTQVLAKDGEEIAVNRMPRASLEALARFCAEGDYPLRFVFSDGLYAYAGYEQYMKWAEEREIEIRLIDGGTQDRHLTELPIAATGIIPPEAAAEFNRLHPEAGLRFPYIVEDHCDILWPGQSKAAGLEALLKHCGLSMGECVSVGDGSNDVEILSATGRSYCVAGGSAQAMAAAQSVCPAAEDCGVAAVCRELWPEAF